MIKSIEEKESSPIEIDLTGPNGNAFCLLGTARDLAKQLGLDGDQICTEMKAGDYENLIQVFDKYFGEYVTLYRAPKIEEEDDGYYDDAGYEDDEDADDSREDD